jgi:hypothetical protein
MRNHRDREGRAATQTSAQQGASTVWREAPHLTAAQFMALPRDRVLVKLMAGGGASGQPDGAGTPYIFIGERLNSIHLFDRLPGSELLHLPAPRSGERVYTDWTVAGVAQKEAAPAAEGETAVESGTGATDDAMAAGGSVPGRGQRGRSGRKGEDGGIDDVSTAEERDGPDAPEVKGMF